MLHRAGGTGGGDLPLLLLLLVDNTLACPALCKASVQALHCAGMWVVDGRVGGVCKWVVDGIVACSELRQFAPHTVLPIIFLDPELYLLKYETTLT